jgi:hypothetical protein
VVLAAPLVHAVQHVFRVMHGYVRSLRIEALGSSASIMMAGPSLHIRACWGPLQQGITRSERS